MTIARNRSRTCVCWVITEGHAGMENQCRGLALALGAEPLVWTVTPRKPWAHLPPRWWWRPLTGTAAGRDFAPPWPDLLISCGRRSVATAMAIKKRGKNRTFAVHIQNPRVDPRFFDAVVVPRHDRLRGENVIVVRGAPHHVTAAVLDSAARSLPPPYADLPRPLVAVMLGGRRRYLPILSKVVNRLCDYLLRASRDHGAGLAVTSSRRTGAKIECIMRARLTGAAARIWDGTGANPYLGLLGLADYIVVTSDSVSMVSEAYSTGKPLYVYDLQGGGASLRAFHRGLRDDGITRVFTGELERWTYAAVNDTENAATELGARIEGRLAKESA